MESRKKEDDEIKKRWKEERQKDSAERVTQRGDIDYSRYGKWEQKEQRQKEVIQKGYRYEEEGHKRQGWKQDRI